MRSTLLAAAVLLGTASLIAQRNVSGSLPIQEQSCYDARSYRLELSVDPEQQSIEGSVTMRATVLADCTRIALDLDDALEVREVTVADRTAKHERGEHRIWIELPEAAKRGAELMVTVRYGGKPVVATNPPWTGGFTWAKTPSGAHWIATTCQGEGADLWWPCKDQPDDEPDTMDIFVTVPKDLVVALNGTLVKDEKRGATRTFHWHVANPINVYCVSLNAAPFAVIESTYTCSDGTKMPVQFFALPEHAAKAKKALPSFLDHVRHLESICGPYPFRNEKYGIVETPHLGMEHQTLIAYGNGFRLEEDGYDWLHHHELSHEWWGNLVTNHGWKDMWIHEGIGTYMQALYLEEKRGKDAYFGEMREKRRGIMNRGAVAPREHRDSHQIYFTLSGNDIYNKGSWICHSLRWLIGDEAFFATLRRWAYPRKEFESATDGTQCRATDTDEIRQIAELVAKRDLGWFFDLYLHQARLPRLDAELKDGVLHVSWHTPEDLPFPMPIEVKVGDTIRRIEMTDGRAELQVGTRDWELDPKGWVLRQNQQGPSSKAKPRR